MTPGEVYALARDEGLDDDSAVIATAVAWAEAGLDPAAVGDVNLEDEKWGPSVGLWQIRSLRADTGTSRARDVERLGDPSFNARSMAVISRGGTNFTPWTMYRNGRYREHVAAVRAAIGGAPLPVVDIIRTAMDDPLLSNVDIVWVPGWESRGRPGTFEPQGLVCHHTATSRYAAGDYPSLTIVRDGRSDLAGPLAQFGLGRSGRVYVVAAGKANHAGPGGWNGLSGNGTVWGIEAENDGIGEPWPARQVAAYLALIAALARATGFGAADVCRHAEWTPYKIDPYDATGRLSDGAWIRSQVSRLLANRPTPTPPNVPKEDDMASPFVLLSYGSGVALWHPSGDVVALASAKQVTDALTRGDVVMDDLTEDQVAQITGAKHALTSGPALADVLSAQEPLGCCSSDD